MPITLTPLETKLLHLVLNGGAAEGEIATGANKLVESLRRRGVSAEQSEQMLGAKGMFPKYTRPDYGLIACPFKKHKGELARDLPPDYIRYMIGWIRTHSDPGVQRKFSQWANDMEIFLSQ
jgi:hypothetical protein